MAQQNAIAHLEAIRHDIRDEVKRRIEQRDRYSIQLTIAMGAIVAVSFSVPNLREVLIAAPLVSIYFTVLILYSYRVHKVMTQYLREEIEPELARLCETAPEKEWETWYAAGHEIPGIRRGFFLGALWFVCLASPIYLWMTESQDSEFKKVLIVFTVLYMVAAVVITVTDKKR